MTGLFVDLDFVVVFFHEVCDDLRIIHVDVFDLHVELVGSKVLTSRALTTPQNMENKALPMMKMGATFAPKKVSCVSDILNDNLNKQVFVIKYK